MYFVRSGRRQDVNGGAQSVAIGGCSDKLHLEPVNGMSLREIADENLRRGIEFVGHDIKIAVVIEIEDRRPSGCLAGAMTVMTPYCPSQDLPRTSGHWRRSLEQSSSNHGGSDLAVPARLDAQDEFGVEKFLSAIVQQKRIDAVTIGEAHARGDEDIVPAVGIQIADAGPQGQ